MWDDETKGAAYVVTAIFSFWLAIIFLIWSDLPTNGIISYYESLVIVSCLLLIISSWGALYYDR